MAVWANMSRLNQRSLTPEIMDDPSLDESAHLRALEGLERINRISRSARNVWSKIATLVKENPQRTLRVLDIATGAGDIPIALCKLAKKSGARLEMEACDISPRALSFAKKRAQDANVAVRFFAHDAVADSVPEGYDVLTSSLFFHHLQTPQATELLTKMGRNTRELLVVNDLVRNKRGWLLAQMATRVLSSSPVVHVDGPRSVEGAFSLSEMRKMAADASLKGFEIERRFPCRFLLSWRRTE